MNDDSPDTIDQKPADLVYKTPEEFAKHYGWSPRKVRTLARQLGACRIMGNRMILLQSDIDAILEASRPPPAMNAGTGNFRGKSAPTRALRSSAQDYEDLLALRAEQKRLQDLKKSNFHEGRGKASRKKDE